MTLRNYRKKVKKGIPTFRGSMMTQKLSISLTTDFIHWQSVSAALWHAMQRQSDQCPLSLVLVLWFQYSVQSFPAAGKEPIERESFVRRTLRIDKSTPKQTMYASVVKRALYSSTWPSSVYDVQHMRTINLLSEINLRKKIHQITSLNFNDSFSVDLEIVPLPFIFSTTL